MELPDARLLLVSDDAALQRAVQVALDDSPVLVTATAGLTEAARYLAGGDVRLAIVDGGSALLREVGALTRAPVLALVASEVASTAGADGEGDGLRRSVGEALDAGAAEVVPREALGLLLPRRVEMLLTRAPGGRWGGAPARVPRAPLPGLRKSDVLVGDSDALRGVLDLVETYADNPYVALVTGETGTGKELVARTLHAASRRGSKPLWVANCTAIPESLFESELFGHERGAFTGATGTREGLVAKARGSTLLLDEIGDLPLSVQPKLLRFLDSGEVRRVGGDRPTHSDARIIASTHRDLPALVRQGAFRQDLYYRLEALHIHVPPLRARREDIPALVARFVALFNEEHQTYFRGFDREALEHLQAHPWPGNIRQLRNVVHRGLIVAKGQDVGIDDLKLDEATPSAALGAPTAQGGCGGSPEHLLQRPFGELRGEVLDRFERVYLDALLRATRGNLSAAARLSHHQRKSLWRMIQRLSIDLDAYRREP